MQVSLVCVLAAFFLGPFPAPSQAGYYKGRPPPPKLIYSPNGPKPPPHFHHKPLPYHGPLRRPVPLHAPRNPIRPPPRPFITKPTPPPPPPFPPSHWKTSSFRAPVVKETFHSAPLAYTPDLSLHFLRDDDKGPIHTIPAPNLGPADRPQQAAAPQALEAVLRHGLETLHSQPASGYQVTEDPSAHKPQSGSPSYFAPDPDPSLPTLAVPQTLDPHSVPSNGQVPLDLALQQQADQTQQQYQQNQQQFTDVSGGALSSQDLYQLLHGLGQQPQQQMTAALYQQYLQAAAAASQQPAAYQHVLYPQQHQVAHFSHPQFETFNYNEQTQEGALGSDSFPSASSVNLDVKRATAESANSIPRDNKQSFLGEGGIVSNQVDYDEDDERSTEESEKETLTSSYINTGYYTTLPDKKTAETLATLAVAGNINSQMMKSPSINERGKQNEDENKLPNTDEVRVHHEKESKPNIFRIEMSQTVRNNDMTKENSAEEQNQYFRNQETRGQENKKQNQQFYSNHEIRATTTEKRPQSENDKEHSFTGDYEEEEILDPSDKDLRNGNNRFQNSMRIYETTYFRDKNEKEKETQIEEQSYEDADYSQDEEKEINNNNKATKFSPATDKGSSYNSQQNQLPFGAKLRPKRV